MPEHELEKLLGGFAADTLTPEERERLFRVALQDQQLFNALADEQALKELLTDPAVRRRLLQSLSRQQGAGPSHSWLDWFARPAGLAWAGGFAAGVFAVILGLKVYQDSLRQASETAAGEEATSNAPAPPTPATTPPGQASPGQSGVTPKAGSPAIPATKDAVIDAQSSREHAAGSQLQDTSDAERAEKPVPSRSKESKKREAPVPSAPAPASDLQILAEGGAGSAPGASAKALFYSEGSSGRELGSRTQEQETAPMLKSEPSALLKTKDRTPRKPLALRYGLFIRESAGQERDVNAFGAEDRPGPVTLTVESNQEAYVQIWTRAGDSLPELVLPAKETGRISLKTVPGQRQEIHVSQENDRVIVRLSRVPFGPITRQEAVMAGRSTPDQVTESASEAQEQATYVANPDLSAAALAIEILLSTHPSR